MRSGPKGRGFSHRPVTVGYRTIHDWIARNFPRVGRCEWCGRSGRTEYASVSHTAYTRNRADWFEFCGRCHHSFDGVDHAARGRAGGRALKGRSKAPMTEAHREAIRAGVLARQSTRRQEK